MILNRHAGRTSEGQHWTHRVWGSLPRRPLLGGLRILLQLQSVQALLTLVRHGLHLINGLWHIQSRSWSWWGRNTFLPVGRLLFDYIPPVLACLLSLLRAVLLLGIFVGALIEKLRIDFHEHFHGVVYHAVDGSIPRVMSICPQTFMRGALLTCSNAPWSSHTAAQT